jgi:23S rRNA (guanosine2251-2'-O)-methyltransferase
MTPVERPAYRDKRAFFDRVITLYGRIAVLEALQDPELVCFRLHLADTNKPAPMLKEMVNLAQQQGAELMYHGKRELSRISRNGKQDQGVAADILCPGFRQFADFLQDSPAAGRRRLLAADGITNPQNVGMLVRSAVAGGIDGIIWPASGNAALGPLAVKASAGTLFKAPLLRCDDLPSALTAGQDAGYQVCTLQAGAAASLFDEATAKRRIYVLGSESHGVSAAVAALADRQLAIPMANGVESLNVAVTAALISYLDR